MLCVLPAQPGILTEGQPHFNIILLSTADGSAQLWQRATPANLSPTTAKSRLLLYRCVKGLGLCLPRSHFHGL